MQRAGEVVIAAMQVMSEHLCPGITTLELDQIGEEVFSRYGAKSAPRIVYDFPGATCISVNDVAAHGIPGKRELRPGDVVNLDLSIERDGYFADMGQSFVVPPISPELERLLACTEEGLRVILETLRPGHPISMVSKIAERVAQKYGFVTVEDMTFGHGIGQKLHDKPIIPGTPKGRTRFAENMAVAIEPFFAFTSNYIINGVDGWALQTFDGGIAMQMEHTVILRADGPLITTR